MELERHQEITAKLLEIVSSEHQETAVDLLTSLTEDNTEVMGTIAKLETDVTNLRKSNANLFLKIGQKQEPEKKETGEPERTLDFESLFNEKGELI